VHFTRLANTLLEGEEVRETIAFLLVTLPIVASVENAQRVTTSAGRLQWNGTTGRVLITGDHRLSGATDQLYDERQR